MEMVNEQTGKSLVPKIPEAKRDGDDTAVGLVHEVEDLTKKVETFFLSTAPHDLKSALLAMAKRIQALEAK